MRVAFAVLIVGCSGGGPDGGSGLMPNAQCTVSGDVMLTAPCEVRLAPRYGGNDFRHLSVAAAPSPRITIYTNAPLDAGRTTRSVCDAQVLLDGGSFGAHDCVVDVASVDPLHGTLTVRLVGGMQRATLSTGF